MLHHRLGDLSADAVRRVERGEGILEHGADPPPEYPSPLRRREGRERILEDGPNPPPEDVSPLHRRELSEVFALK